MKKNIVIIALAGCTLCKKIIQGFAEENIQYAMLDADENSELCDKVEALLNIFHYPIVFTDNGIAGKHYHYLNLHDSTTNTYGLRNGDTATSHPNPESLIKYFT